MVKLALEVPRLVDLVLQAVALQHGQQRVPCFVEAVVEVDRSDQGLKRVSHHGVMDVFTTHFGLDEVVQAHFLAQQIEVLAVDDAAFPLGQLALLGFRKIPVEVMGHRHVQHHIAQKLESFVALQACLVAVKHGTVRARFLIGTAVPGPCAQPKFATHQGRDVFVRPRLGNLSQPLQDGTNHERALNTTDALWPPKPNVLLNAARTSRFSA